MRHSKATSATATGDTTRTSVGTVSIPDKARIIAVACYACAAATLTTGEAVTGIFDMTLAVDSGIPPNQYPLDVITILTSGAVAFQVSWFPVDWNSTSTQDMEFFVTMDVAQTGALKARGLVQYDL